MQELKDHEKKYEDQLKKRAENSPKRSISHSTPKRQPNYFSKLVDEQLF